MAIRDDIAQKRSRLSERRARLPEAQRALLEKRLRGKPVSKGKGIPRRQEEGPAPLSFSQERLWFLDQLDPGNPAYNLPTAVRLVGRLDIAALERALNGIVQRHESLRTTFAALDGRAVQIVAPTLTWRVPVVDLRGLSLAEREALIQRLATQEAQRPFDLTRGPLVRATLLKLQEAVHVLLLTVHHIVSDGWSMGVLVQEVAVLYDAFSSGRPSPLAALPLQYADFACWQRNWLQGEVLEAHVAYWRQQLADAPAMLELPTDRPRPAVQDFVGAIEHFEIGEDWVEKLRALGQQEGVSLYMMLVAAYQALLYRYTGQEDMSVGSFIANRNRSQTERLIGFFVNTLVLRTDLSGNPSFRQLLNRVRRVTLDAYAHQDLPFEKLLEELQPERTQSHTPFFQMMLVLQNMPSPSLQRPELHMESLPIEHEIHAHFDLTLWLWEAEDRLIGDLEYSAALFDPATIRRIVEHLCTLLESAVADPAQHLSDLTLLTEPELHQLLVEWNGPCIDYPAGRRFHDLFEAQVERSCDAVAVVFSELQLTYGALNRRANQLAHYLQAMGVEGEAPVGICLERSLEMIVGVLAVLKAGGAYVPLDPVHPLERLAFILQDTQAPVLVTQSQLCPELSDSGVRAVYLDTDAAVIVRQSQENPAAPTMAENLAYLIYTSGSTGKPKGVTVTHDGWVSIYRAWAGAYQLETDCRCHLQIASFTFDVFAGDLARAFCSGGKLVLCPREVLLAPQELYDLMCREKVDCVEFVPVVVKSLAEYMQRKALSFDFVRVLVVGSESWYIQEYQQVHRLCGPETRLINSYGLSETTIDSSYFERTALTLDAEATVPIGRPFANVEMYLLDAHLNLVPTGVPGELYIGGAGLSEPVGTDRRALRP